MPIEKKPTHIRIRVADPKQFVRFVTKELGKGIRAVIGYKKKGSQIQSLLFPRKRYTLKQAKAWVKAHNYTIQESYWVNSIDISPKSLELVLEETVAKDDDDVPEMDIEEMKEDEFKWLIE